MRTTDRDRITIDEMLWAMVSSYILTWNDVSIPAQAILEFVSNVAIELHYALGYDEKPADSIGRHVWLSNRVHHFNPSWLTMLSRVCLQYKDCLQEERIRKLQAVGRRFRPVVGTPFNGIFNAETYLRAGRSIEGKIGFLREIVSLNPTSDKATERDTYEFLIVYKNSYNIVSNDGTDTKALEVFEYATALPEFGVFGLECRKVIDDRQREIHNMRERIDFFDTRQPVFTLHGGIKTQLRNSSTPTIGTGISWRTQSGRSINATKDKVEFVKMTTYNDSKTCTTAVYFVVSGSLDNVALLRLSRRDIPIIHQHGTLDVAKNEKWQIKELTTTKIPSLFQPGSVDFTKCVIDIGTADTTLLAMTLIESLYKGMDNMTVDVRAVQANFSEAKWLQSAIAQGISITRSKKYTISLRMVDSPVSYLHTGKIDTATCFACIAMMETGNYNLDPNGLRNVFGLCVSDSLYIASCLLRDPADRLNGSPVQRFTGNIGRAGMAFMVPPNEPEIRRYDLIDEWYQYDHNVFTGIMEDCFKRTSLHLSFSEASQAINVNFSGGRDVEAYFLESLISVYNRDEWIAELDILGLVTNPNLKSSDELPGSKACNCKDHSMHGGPTVISIDNFAEMLVPPNQPGIIRAKGNWQARLAATALCLAKGYRVVIKAPGTCLACVVDMAATRDPSPSRPFENKDVLMII
ncbi:hypothetical protein E0Z10_g6029 [Xylaria hypoxylon]|uniref:Uncharacterized protein n=1 Tax=Xylaria hypoxylon TaxID=37992 RepID=A0A4Z0YUD8_9PEZI|nr:hypothetical protein E0Z10_g6029 [Xylaria hypoxylon]